MTQALNEEEVRKVAEKIVLLLDGLPMSIALSALASVVSASISSLPVEMRRSVIYDWTTLVVGAIEQMPILAKRERGDATLQ